MDPNKLHRNGTTSLKSMSFSNDGKYCAYGISKGGSDWVTIKIKNTETLEDLPENITKVISFRKTYIIIEIIFRLNSLQPRGHLTT